MTDRGAIEKSEKGILGHRTMTKTTRLGRRRAAAATDGNPFYLERRQAIFAAAIKVFRERGYENMTLAHVAEELNYDRATLYYYASSKQQLFQDIVRDTATDNIVAVEKIAESAGNAEQKLKTALSQLMESYARFDPFLHLFMQQLLQNISAENESYAESRSFAERYYKAIRSILQQGVDDREFVLNLPVGMAAMAVIGAVNWTQISAGNSRRTKKPSDLSPLETGQALAELLIQGIVHRDRACKLAS